MKKLFGLINSKTAQMKDYIEISLNSIESTAGAFPLNSSANDSQTRNTHKDNSHLKDNAGE
jgi:hypothetical protein